MHYTDLKPMIDSYIDGAKNYMNFRDYTMCRDCVPAIKWSINKCATQEEWLTIMDSVECGLRLLGYSINSSMHIVQAVNYAYERYKSLKGGYA